MTEILGEKRLRFKNQVTVPLDVIELLNFKQGEFVRFEKSDNDGTICIKRAVTRTVTNNNKQKKKKSE